MKKYISAAQLWGLTTAYVDMCNDIALYEERNAPIVERNNTKADMDSTSVAWEYTDLLRTTESGCRKLGNKIVDFINERFDGNLPKIVQGFFDKQVLDKALEIIEENYKEYVLEDKCKELVSKENNKRRSEGVTLEEAYRLWKK